MNVEEHRSSEAVIVEAELHFSLHELSRACGASVSVIESLVHEGILTPRGEHPTVWRFEGSLLPRARRAARLSSELELGPSGTALVLELLEEIASLKAQLRRSRG
jgi:chaperone modulatory protein CbpM